MNLHIFSFIVGCIESQIKTANREKVWSDETSFHLHQVDEVCHLPGEPMACRMQHWKKAGGAGFSFEISSERLTKSSF